MQEDIFERLHYHSGLVAQGCWDELDDYDREAIRRFGDLVVAECINACGSDFGTKLIREHFGIAE
jgi:hypothetical protein